ncbi:MULTISPECIES: prephenate dehydratase domain-containing protein [unclassified Mesotoga]|uniref:prephenate dehydratase domain-containing protein n=1 Tax=unclassified Mesotoga TaxID=1184398 RepID=UPI002154FE09|nr:MULTISPECIES: prephenate dehydratase domain-containing protein [unclassified Mesotoga]
MNGKVVAFQGEHGAYSEQAIRKLLGESPVTIPCRSFQEMLNLVPGWKSRLRNSPRGKLSGWYSDSRLRCFDG